MAVNIPPKLIRALTNARDNVLQVPSPVELACWNWALAGDDANAAPIAAAYDYVNGLEPQPTLVDYPDAIGTALADLVDVYNDFTLRGQAYSNNKRAQLTVLSGRMLPILCGLYGLPVSNVQTDIEIGLKFEAQLVKRNKPTVDAFGNRGTRPERDDELQERLQDLGVGYEHMWIRFKKKTTVETWVNLPRVFVHHAEQPPQPHKTVVRTYVSQLDARHLAKLTALIQMGKGAVAPFVHPLVRRPWIADANADRCRWCNTTFGLFTRKHHCRACGHIFCSDCAFKEEVVAQPSHPPLAMGAAVPNNVRARVCDTCYTGND